MALYVSIICIVISLIIVIKNYLLKTSLRSGYSHAAALICLITLLAGVSKFTLEVKDIVDRPIEQVEIQDSLLIESTKQEMLFVDSVYQYILFLNIKHPEVVLKQAIIESGNFKSKVFRENNNMFGMKIPYKRANIAGGENLGYAVYNTWQESIIDYALYQTYSARGMTKEEYIQHLGASYAEDPNYKSKIR